MQPKRIPLIDRKGVTVAYAIVDAEDYLALAAYRWGLNGNGYALRTGGGGVLMHREILGLRSGDGLCCDHINRDKLDNRRANLRAVTHAQNQQNRGSLNGSSSAFRSVHWCSKANRWRARIRQDHRSIHLGYFADELAAALATEAYRVEHMPFAQPDPVLIQALMDRAA